MSYWARTLILQQPDNKVSEGGAGRRGVQRCAGEREVRHEVHQDYEVASEDEQLQLLPRPALRAGLGAHQETW